MSTNKKPKPKDPFFRIKHIGYCMSDMPSQKADSADFLNFCKFQLCVQTRRLMKDPIWDSYTPEEIMAEYFAWKFHLSAEAKNEYELALGDKHGAIDDFSKWADDQMKKEAEIEKQVLESHEDRVSFKPQDVMGD